MWLPELCLPMSKSNPAPLVFLGLQRRSFSKHVEGAEPVKTAQSTIKILKIPRFLPGFDTISHSVKGIISVSKLQGIDLFYYLLHLRELANSNDMHKSLVGALFGKKCTFELCQNCTWLR